MIRFFKNTFFLCLLIPAGLLYAQLSPGELAKSHAMLEGTENCTQCHNLGKKLDNQKCLDCHTIIKSKIDKNQGYHASSEVINHPCFECHHDHLGKSFQMVEWKPSKNRFNHDLTGYKLEGKHKTDQCEACHKPDFITGASVLSRVKDGLDLMKTYLGLSQECSSCHFDEHRGQLKNCISCHDFSDWKKSAEIKFDHSKTKYPLTGNHVSVKCEKCHHTINDPQKKLDGKVDDTYLKYSSLEFNNCTSCHIDPHANKFGKNCESCHNTSSWIDIRNKNFSHNLTRYPLVDRHLFVPCESCHQPDRKKSPIYKNMKFAACRDCHVDVHLGQLDKRQDRGACETCHNLKGFRPSIFTVELHNRESFYRLQGAHEKTECNKCHLKLSSKEFTERSGFSVKSDSSYIILKFKNQKCSSCHSDIHRGQFGEKLKRNDCDICHKTTSWKDLLFDHDRDSEFQLFGKHKIQTCDKCHRTLDANTPMKRVEYKPISKLCASCHKDIHEKQFVNKDGVNSCEKCHNSDSFKPSIFDHNKQSRYILDGAHQKVDCLKCHLKVKIKSDTLVTLYKPISTDCAACHPDQHDGVFENK